MKKGMFILFINNLEIVSNGEAIRSIDFHAGVNLIVDETQSDKTGATGNGVGKTTVLRLIDFCFGKKRDSIYRDSDSGKDIVDVKQFLTRSRVLIRLTLSEGANEVDETSKYIIERNFLSGKEKIQRLNGKDINTISDLPKQLGVDLFDIPFESKPSFRQLITRSFRVDPPAVDHTLRFLPGMPTLSEYETLFLFMFGEPRADRTNILDQLKKERAFRRRIETEPLSQLKQEQQKTRRDIDKLILRRKNLNIEPEYGRKVTQLDNLNFRLAAIDNRLSTLNLKLKLIKDSQQQIQKTRSLVDVDELRSLYEEAKSFDSTLSRSFSQLVDYHNEMIASRVKFIGQEVPDIQAHISDLASSRQEIFDEHEKLMSTLKASHTNAELEKISEKLGQLYQEQGRRETKISQIVVAKEKVESLEKQLNSLDESAFSEESQERVMAKTIEFSNYFMKLSEDLYDEEFGVTFQVKKNRRSGEQYYDFYTFEYGANNSSSGKKQGEIAAFDLAYIMFAREQNIPVFDFVLYDKKELMYGKQLSKISEIAVDQQIQVIMPMLSDKLTDNLAKKENIVLRLSDKEKLFKF